MVIKLYKFLILIKAHARLLLSTFPLSMCIRTGKGLKRSNLTQELDLTDQFVAVTLMMATD